MIFVDNGLTVFSLVFTGLTVFERGASLQCLCSNIGAHWNLFSSTVFNVRRGNDGWFSVCPSNHSPAGASAQKSQP